MNRNETTLQELKEILMKDPEFVAEYNKLEPGYQVARLRIMRGLSQKELAERIGTKQPSIARLESGERPPSIEFLRRVAEGLGADLDIRISLKENEA